jgi:hypothetical protein
VSWNDIAWMHDCMIAWIHGLRRGCLKEEGEKR